MADQENKGAELRHRSKLVWKRRGEQGKDALIVLRDIMEHVAEYRDWTVLADFVSASGVARPKINRIISVAFGDKLTFDKERAKKAANKIAYAINWPVDVNPLAGSNSYGVVLKAIDDKKAFDAKDFQAELGKMLGKPEGAPVEFLKELSNTLAYLEKKIKDVPDLGAYLAKAVADLETKKAFEEAKAKG